MWWWYAIILLAVAYAALVLWYKSAWQSLPLYPQVPSDFQPATTVTVLVPARNEAANIAACLKSLVAQRFPASLLQIIVLDDASEDETAAIANSIAHQHAFVQVIAVPPAAQSHKKRAIEYGIAQATGQLIVCTDADCAMGPNWLMTLVHAHETKGWQFIAAPVQYIAKKQQVLQVFQVLDFLTLQGITAASVSKNFHAMCNGANIAYSKKAFEEVGGFAGIDALPTGDDMLLMHKIWQRNPEAVGWIKSTDAIVYTQPCPTWKAFFQQRIRWASKAAYYQDKKIIGVLLLVYVLNVSLLLALIVGLIASMPKLLLAFGLALVLKTMVEFLFLAPVAQFFQQQQWLNWFHVLQLHHIVYTVIAGWLGRFGSYQWKGRRVEKPSTLVKKKDN
ncbi:MAG: glycosyltransferase [Chitinophagaceae bacterium]|nr:glycosyltransferase [Chitinophagaceae bacterium]